MAQRESADRPADALVLTGLTRPGAVVQADRPVSVRGLARPGQVVTVTLAGKQAQVTADDMGRWQCALPPLPVGGPYQGHVVTAEDRLGLEDVHAGQVWLCAGQSNMAMSLANTVVPERPTPDAGLKQVVRFAQVPARVAATPSCRLDVTWRDAVGHSAVASAVGYHFAQQLAQTLGMPVGFVQSAVGHTPAMAWTGREHLAPDSAAARQLAQFDRDCQAHPAALHDLESHRARMDEAMKQWNRDTTGWFNAAWQAIDAGQAPPAAPVYPQGLGSLHTPTVLYNAMLAPLAGEALAGVLWYQGESDAILGLHDAYGQSLRGLIASWRGVLGPVPVVLVQLPRHQEIQGFDADVSWPAVRQAQRQAMADDDAVGLVPTLDLGQTRLIHPVYKQALGRRAAMIALAMAHPSAAIAGRVHRHGPLACDAAFDAQGVTVRCSGVVGGLCWRDAQAAEGRPAELEAQVAGRWQKVTADLRQPDSLRVQAEGPIDALRYAWQADPVPTLWDEAGWPLSPFYMRRTH